MELVKAVILDYAGNQGSSEPYTWGQLSVAVLPDGSSFACCRVYVGNERRIGMWLVNPEGEVVKHLLVQPEGWIETTWYYDSYVQAIALEDYTVQVLAPFYVQWWTGSGYENRDNHGKSYLIDCSENDIKIIAEYDDKREDGRPPGFYSPESSHYYFREIGIVLYSDGQGGSFYAYKKGRPLAQTPGPSSVAWSQAWLHQSPSDATKFAVWAYGGYAPLSLPAPVNPYVQGAPFICYTAQEFQIDPETGAVTSLGEMRTTCGLLNQDVSTPLYISSPYEADPVALIFEMGTVRPDAHPAGVVGDGLKRTRLYNTTDASVVWEMLSADYADDLYIWYDTIAHVDQDNPGVAVVYTSVQRERPLPPGGPTTSQGWFQPLALVVDSTKPSGASVETLLFKYPGHNPGDPDSPGEHDLSYWGYEELAAGSTGIHHRDGRIVVGSNTLMDQDGPDETWPMIFVIDGGAKYPFAAYDGTDYLKAGDGIAPTGQLKLKANASWVHSACSSDDPDTTMWPLKILTEQGWKVVAMMTEYDNDAV